MVQRLRKYFFSITAGNFLFFCKSTVLFPTLPWKSNTSLISPAIHFPFCDNGLFEEQNRKTGLYETWNIDVERNRFA